MQSLQLIADFLSRFGIIPVLVLVILQLIGFDNMRKAFGFIKSDSEIPVETRIVETPKFLSEYIKLMQSLEGQNKTLLENHFQHEIPDMIAALNRIENGINKQNDLLIRIDAKLK